MKVDKYGYELEGLGFGHFACHAAKVFQATITIAAGAAATTTDTSIVIPTGYEMHLGGIRARYNGTSTISLIKAPTGVSGGTAIVPWNRHAGSALTAKSAIKQGASGTTDGTTLPLGRLISATGVGNKGTLGSQEGTWDDEIILPAGTHVLRIVTGATTTNDIDIDLIFVEVAV